MFPDNIVHKIYVSINGPIQNLSILAVNIFYCVQENMVCSTCMKDYYATIDNKVIAYHTNIR